MGQQGLLEQLYVLRWVSITVFDDFMEATRELARITVSTAADAIATDDEESPLLREAFDLLCLGRCKSARTPIKKAVDSLTYFQHLDQWSRMGVSRSQLEQQMLVLSAEPGKSHLYLISYLALVTQNWKAFEGFLPELLAEEESALRLVLMYAAARRMLAG